jgi:hypothetical protein
MTSVDIAALPTDSRGEVNVPAHALSVTKPNVKKIQDYVDRSASFREH